jgi:hypothetical protein
MDVVAFVRSIYLGDRVCRSVLINGWRERVEVTVDLISRIRSESGRWDFYSAEDIEEGRIVFTGVTSVSLVPAGLVPNDYIQSLRVDTVSPEGASSSPEHFAFTVEIGSVDRSGGGGLVTLSVVAAGVHLEDPERPGETITV